MKIGPKELIDIVVNEVVKKLKRLRKYELTVDGCGCCGNYVSAEADEFGDWVKLEDIEDLINYLTTKPATNETTK